MRQALRLIPLLTLLALNAPLAGQMKPGHVFLVGFYQVVPGKGPAYNKALADVTIPVLDEMVKHKTIVAYQLLAQSAGAGEYTNLFILELENWAGFDGLTAKLNDASQAVLHKSWSDATAGFSELRRAVRFEHYGVAGQQP